MTAKKTTTAGADNAPAVPRTRRTAAKKTTGRRAAPAAADVAPELVLADPATLVVGANVRVDPRLDADFIDSIRERGVLEPVIAYRDGDGRLVVLRGQRRTVASVQVGRPTVPVVVVPEPDDVDRLVDQLAENDHRAGLESGERAAAFTQLAAFGLPAGDIAKRTASPRAAIDRALAVASSERVQAVYARHPDLTFDHLAAVAEFEDDERAVEALEQAAANGSGFAHVAQSLRDTRDQRQAMIAAEKALTDAGVRVVEKLNNRPKAARLDRLTGAGGEALTVEGHAGCPGHAAHLEEDWLYPGDDGYPADRVVDDPDDEDAAVYAAVPVYLCLDWAKHGHVERYPSRSTSTPAAELPPDERAAAAAERRRVIAGNKAWDSAQVVRRRWLADFVTRKTAPKTAAGFVAGSLIRRDTAVSHMLMNGIDYLRELLGLQPEGHSWGGDGAYEAYKQRRRELSTMVEQATEGRSMVLALAAVLAAYEQGTTRDSWRHTRITDTDGTVSATPRYLRYLESCGYELSTIELQACGVAPPPEPEPEPEPVDQGLLEAVGLPS